jgi:NitT/TauT family transport system permease protein
MAAGGSDPSIDPAERSTEPTTRRGPPTATPDPSRSQLRPTRRSLAVYAAFPIALGVVAVADPGLSSLGVARYLPTAGVDVFYSFLRMLSAYTLSLGFSLAYGYYAATRRTAERVMIPILDVLQSVPILGFFPVVIVLLVGIAGPRSFLGPNLASVFLIFTSMAWNMVFGVYESVKTLPAELREAAETFGARGWLRFRKVLFPATANRLVYNSVLSWTGGWFFLVEAEIFTTNSHALRGIGSFLAFSAAASNANAFVAGIIALGIVIVLLDFAVWRPLGQWAERFRYDQAPSGEGTIAPPRDAESRFRRATAYLTRGVISGVARIRTPFVQLAAIAVRPRRPRSAFWRSATSYVALGAILVICWLLLIEITVAVFHVYTGPISASVRRQMLELPLAMGASTLRVAAAYAISLAIALPLAIHLARTSKGSRVGLPVIEVIASFPATALFPVIIFQLVPHIGAEGAAVLMLLTGMIWYLFFNLLSGVRALAPDLEEAARAFGLRGRTFLRRVVLPGLFPALVTGSITAFGGGWNTLIVAEYLNVGVGHRLSLLGIGQLIDLGYAEGAYPLMVGALFTLVAGVIALNELLWKPLYRRAAERYRYD